MVVAVATRIQATIGAARRSCGRSIACLVCSYGKKTAVHCSPHWPPHIVCPVRIWCEGNLVTPDLTSIDKANKWQTLSPKAGGFDLLALQNDVTAKLGELELPEGKIT